MCAKHWTPPLADNNRPYNIQNLADGLASVGYKKAQIQKALDSLAEAKRIVMFTNGKQVIYHALQEDDADYSAEASASRRTLPAHPAHSLPPR